MNWDAIGAIAELLASITVIITLIYLTTQVRQANTGLRVAAARDIATANVSWIRSVREDPEMCKIYRQGLEDIESLKIEDRGRFDLLLIELFNELDGLFHQFQAGSMNEDQWQTVASTFRSVIDKPGGNDCWQRQKKFAPMSSGVISTSCTATRKRLGRALIFV
jgi:hypothetical protein